MTVPSVASQPCEQRVERYSSAARHNDEKDDPSRRIGTAAGSLCEFPIHAVIRIPPHCTLVDNGDGRHFIAGDHVYRVELPTDAARLALKRIASRRGASFCEVSALIGIRPAHELIQQLATAGLLQHSDHVFSDESPSGTDGYLDCALRDHARLRPLAEVGVLVVGCGGLGGELARHLVSSNVGWIGLVDNDVVMSDNLNRQYLFTINDVGHNKVDVAAEVLRDINSRACIEPYKVRVESLNDLDALRIPKHIDAVACCADTPVRSIRAITSEFAIARSALFATAGVGVNTGSWGPIVRPDCRPTYRESRLGAKWQRYPDISTPTCVSFGPTNAFVAAALARDMVHVLLGNDAASLHAEVAIDFRSYSVTVHNMRQE